MPPPSTPRNICPKLRCHGWMITPCTTRLTTPVGVGPVGRQAEGERLQQCVASAPPRHSARPARCRERRSCRRRAELRPCPSPSATRTERQDLAGARIALQLVQQIAIVGARVASFDNITTTSVRSLTMVFGPWRKPSVESATATTRPSVSSSIFSAASRPGRAARCCRDRRRAESPRRPGAAPAATPAAAPCAAALAQRRHGFGGSAPKASAAVEQHRAEARGHREAAIVGRFRQHQHEGAAQLPRALSPARLRRCR